MFKFSTPEVNLPSKWFNCVTSHVKVLGHLRIGSGHLVLL